MNCVKSSLLSERTILRRRNKLLAELRDLQARMVLVRHQLDCGFQARCPHPPKYVRMQWGQYERCCDVCDLCGAELN